MLGREPRPGVERKRNPRNCRRKLFKVRGAAGSIKPGVKRSETPGTQCKKIGKARKAADSSQTVLNDSRCSTMSASMIDEVNMSDSYTNLLYHLVFSTKERRPLITPEYELRLYEYIEVPFVE